CGAKALGLDDRIGTLEAGKEADITLINTADVNVAPVNDPFSAVVFSADRKNVDTVFCRGRKLKENGMLLTLDKDEVIHKTKERWEDILRR
ncbi:MAG: amidohydrolase family protein, partial [Spirochaetes bacterium]|nr:amidohydrolase family protein [Candidatus Ornithospirochaeta stercoripullorum]